jgi:quinoprotein relay system zinc metallohydrolase 2
VAFLILAGATPGLRAEAAPPPFAVEEVAPGVFVHHGQYGLFTPRNSGDVSNCGFVVGDEAVAVIDTSGSYRLGRALLAAIRAHTNKPVRYVINTHMHPDHVFGNAAFSGERPRFVGHKKLARALSARSDRYLAANRELLGDEAFEGTQIIMPDTPVDGRMEIDLGRRKLVLTAEPTAHTDNDLIVLDETSGTLFLGDLLFSVHVPALDGSIRGWLAVLDKLKNEKIARAVPGHGPVSMPWPEALAAEQRYLSRIATEVREAVKQGRTIAETTRTAGQSERGQWQLFDEFNARNVSAAFAELEWE